MPGTFRGYAATVWGAIQLRAGLVRPAVDSIDFFRFRQDWNLKGRRAFGFDARVFGQRPVPTVDGSGTLLVSNHAGFADMHMLLCEVPPECKLTFIAKLESKNVPIFGWHLQHYRDILFDRNDREQRRSVIARAIERLRDGFCVALFPEGTRAAGGEPKAQIHPGLIAAAIAAGLPIQPVAIAGSFRLFGDWRRRHVGHPIHARFGPARCDYATPEAVWNDVLQMWNALAPLQKAAEAAHATRRPAAARE